MGCENSENIFRILVATDNHLGYAEKDDIRGNDSFNTFKEVLELAESQKVDFVLLGGDLFHKNKPSRQCLVKCMELLKTHTFGDKPVEFDFVSDASDNFQHLRNPVVNFQDPNLNVAIPVFSIHGNHDDPAGLGQFCALDMLSTAGLINYFGRCNNLRQVTVSPLLLVKGTAKLAIFGLSAIKDERLFRLFKEGNVRLLRPAEYADDWYNIMVLHQNHTARPPTNYIPEEFLDSFLDLVIWGHEHECKIEPIESKQNFFIMQPGSSVATSLCEGEAIAKHVALLEVNDQRCIKVTKLPLRTVRPFVFKNVSLSDYITELSESKGKKKMTVQLVQDYLEKTVHQMIEDSKKQLTGHPRQPSLPLLRLRVEYSQENELFNPVSFGHRFTDLAANTEDILLFRKFRNPAKKEDGSLDKDAMDAAFGDDISESRVEDLVQQYFHELDGSSHQHLQVMTETGLGNAVTNFVDKDDKDAIADIFQYQLERTLDHLLTIEGINEDTVDYHINLYKAQRAARADNDTQERAETDAVLNAEGRTVRGQQNSRDGDDDSVSDDGNSDTDTTADLPARGRGSKGPRGGRGSRGPRGGRGGRGAAAAAPLNITGGGDKTFGSKTKVPSMFSRQSSAQSSGSGRSSSSRKKASYFDDSD